MAADGGGSPGAPEERLEIPADRRDAFLSGPADFPYPRRPATPFLERERLPWFPMLEAATAMIRTELEGAMEADRSPRGLSLWLWRDGVRRPTARALCPRTDELLSRLPLTAEPGLGPSARFWTLEAHEHIPPRTGPTNSRLPVHLPLILPGPARLRVGNDIREWKLGEAWAFDDTVEHEAWNCADRPAVILVFEVWNPLLSEAERDLVSEMTRAREAPAHPPTAGPT